MKPIKEKWLTWLLSAALIFTVLPVTAFADSSPAVQSLESVYVNGSAGDDANTGADSTTAVKTLERALELVAEGGTIYVGGTVTVNTELEVNGARIERAAGYTGSLISVSGSDAELTLTDSVIDGKHEEGTTYSGYLVFITDGGTLNIEENTQLINNNATAVYVNTRSFLNMNGGAIKNNTITDQNFGGGGIYTCGTTVINGGEISENSSFIWGGGILAERGTLTMNGGEIKNNSAANGAGVTVNGGAQAVLDGASITGNTAEDYGAGVYIQGFANYDNIDTVFEMKSGVISGNILENYTGAGIFGYYYNGNTIIRISGGSIKENVSDMGSAVAIYGFQGSVAYPRLELSGSPEISGDIFYQNDYDYGYVIHVTDEFAPVCPVEITRSNNIHDIPAVEYAAGLTPNRDDFVSGIIFDGFVVDGQNLLWAKAGAVYFYDEDGKEYRDNRHGVVMGEKIDIADAPMPTKTGYSFDGWYEEDSTEPWDFDEDIVQDSRIELYERWNLNAPAVTLKADDTTPHIGTSATITAETLHDLDNVTYTYQWYRDGKLIEEAASDTLTVSEPGAYSVKVTASDGVRVSSETESAPVEISIEDHTTGEWNTDGTSHWKVCSVCGDKVNVESHSFKWVVDKAASAKEAGIKHEECTVCGYEKAAVEIPAAGTSTSPKTGDDSNIALWISLILVSGTALTGVVLYSRKKKYNR